MTDTKTLLSIVEGLGRPKVVIIGDLIIDRYISGEVTRISPEAPIPVLAVRSSGSSETGNVAANLVAMDATVEIVGVVGDDNHGLGLRKLFEESGIGSAASSWTDLAPPSRRPG